MITTGLGFSTPAALRGEWSGILKKAPAMELNEITGQIIDAAMKVHSALGPGKSEYAYEACLEHELRKRGLGVRRQVPLPIIYDGERIDAGYRLDLLVEGKVIVEVKATGKISAKHREQLLSYLRMSGRKIGLLINFRTRRLKDGIRRMVNRL